MLWSLAYLVVRRLFELMVLCCRSPESKELEILVLRHELSIVRRRRRGNVGAVPVFPNLEAQPVVLDLKF